MNREKEIAQLLISLGFQANHLGYQYTLAGIQMVLNDNSVLKGITKVLYPAVAETHGTTPSRVERAIRHSIETAHSVKTPAWLGLVTHNCHRPGPPTNSWFMASLAEFIRLGMTGATLSHPEVVRQSQELDVVITELQRRKACEART